MSVENGIYIRTNVKHKNLAVIRGEQAGAHLIAGIEEDSYKELVRSTYFSRYTKANPSSVAYREAFEWSIHHLQLRKRLSC